jgi:exodeoxyribonuclease V
MTLTLDPISTIAAALKGVDLGLNDEQLEVYTRIVSGDFSKLLLMGEAGAGKTYVLTQALAALHRAGTKVLICAPTHLARITLLNKLPEDVRPYIETRTVASLLSRFGFNTGDGGVGFSKPKADRLGKYQVIALDECSMIGKAEYDVLMSASGAKIIFTGDFKQLPAIMQKGSGMMDDPTVEKFNLVQQMRAPGVIHDLAQLNRAEVHFPTKSVADDHSEVVVHTSLDQLLQCMANDIVSDQRGVDSHPHYRFITHTNAKMYEVGVMIRDLAIAAELGDSKPPIVAGEYMLNYETCPAAYNGEVVKVRNVLPDGGASHSRLWDSFKVEVEGSRGICWVNVIDPRKVQVAEKYIEQQRELLKEANKRKSFDAAKGYYDEIQHLTNYWTKMFYPFAMTVHKSQGQTIEHTYVDTLSFAKASNKRALLYVGLSRASKALHTVIVPKPRWEVVREINNSYRITKARYEQVFGEPAYKVRGRTGLPARTPEQKQVLTEYMEALIADAEQAIADGESSIVQRVTPEILAEVLGATKAAAPAMPLPATYVLSEGEEVMAF